MEQSRHSVHLDQILDVLLLVETLLCNLHPLVMVQFLSKAGAAAIGARVTAFCEAAAECFEERDKCVSEIACIKFLALLDLVSQDIP